jgi:hypothetical protein
MPQTSTRTRTRTEKLLYDALQWQNNGSGGKTTDLVNYGKSFRPIMYEFWHVDQQLQNFLKEIKTTYKKILLFELNIAPTN